jgi:hypothetical protein
MYFTTYYPVREGEILRQKVLELDTSAQEPCPGWYEKFNSVPINTTALI